MIKYYRFGWYEVLWKISYKNLLMLMVTIPDPDLEEVKELNTMEDFKKYLKI